MSRKTVQRLIIVSVIVLAALVFRTFGLDEYLKLSYIKASRQQLEQLYAAHSNLFMAGYGVLYILVTALSLPGAAVLTLAGGALFGFWTGVLIVSFASTIGATLAFMSSRFLFRDWVQARFTDRITLINEGIEKEGAFYLFTLRLIPVFPFFIINLVMGLTTMPTMVFSFVSQIGMLPATIVFVNAGKELSKIDSIASVFSPGLIFSFCLIGLLPLIAKKAVIRFRQNK
ncbi:MAG: TVP38/TMEM64 family protein [Nitrospirae bacterium]|nr:MAG: TVP38/TMEM64 family protein [Nitrospirota bacterium]